MRLADFGFIHDGLRTRRIGGVDEDGDTGHRGHKLTQEFEPLRYQFAEQEIDTGQVAPRSGEAGHQSKLDGIFGDQEHDRNDGGRGLGCDGWSGATMRGDERDPLANQLGRQCRQAVELVLGPAVFDRDVLALDKARLLEALAKCAQTVHKAVGRYGAEEADHRHRWLLRVRGERPCRRAAESCDKFSPFQPIEFHLMTGPRCMIPNWQRSVSAAREVILPSG